MTRLILVLFVALLVAFGAAWLAENSGVVTLTIANYEFRSSASVAAVLMLSLLILLGVLLKTISWIVDSPAKLSAFIVERRAGKAYQTLSRGFAAAAAGETQEAAQAARHAEKLLGKSPLVLLLNAQAADLAHDDEYQQTACTEMLVHPETEFLAASRLAQLAERRGNSKMALDFALRAHALKPDSLKATATLFDLRIQGGERADAEALLEKALEAHLLSPETETRWREALRSLGGTRASAGADSRSAPA